MFQADDDISGSVLDEFSNCDAVHVPPACGKLLDVNSQRPNLTSHTAPDEGRRYQTL